MQLPYLMDSVPEYAKGRNIFLTLYTLLSYSLYTFPVPCDLLTAQHDFNPSLIFVLHLHLHLKTFIYLFRVRAIKSWKFCLTQVLAKPIPLQQVKFLFTYY